jgi:hypothetical protein
MVKVGDLRISPEPNNVSLSTNRNRGVVVNDRKRLTDSGKSLRLLRQMRMAFGVDFSRRHYFG